MLDAGILRGRADAWVYNWVGGKTAMKKSAKKAMKTVVKQQKEFLSVVDAELPSVMIGVTPDGQVAFYVTNGDPDDVLGLVSAVGASILSGQLAAPKDGQASESGGRVNVH